MALQTVPRLGFISSRSGHADAGGSWTHAGVGRVVEALRTKFARVTLALSQSSERAPLHDHRLDFPENDLLWLPPLSSLARGLFQVAACHRTIREVERRSDVVLIQVPFESPVALLQPRKPRLYHVIAHLWEVAKNSPRYGGVRRPAALLMAASIDTVYRNLMHRPGTRTIANGAELLDHYRRPPGCAAISATLRREELMSVPRKRSQPDQFRILYVGYIRPQKGLEVLLAAHRLVQEDLPGAELCIVGGRDMPANAQTDGLLCKLEELRRTHALIFAGHVPFGPQLFQSYADADVLVAPSTAGEGTPRVLVEARAFGCPVIATTTGGIPSSVTDGVDGLLVPANDPVALRAAILRVATDHALRARLVAAGLRRARQCTVESFAEAMAAEVALLAEPFGRVVA